MERDGQAAIESSFAEKKKSSALEQKQRTGKTRKSFPKGLPQDNIPFYRAFEERHRGSRELVKERLRVYLPFVLHCQELYEECSALDLGCGRGEWLELLAENGFDVFGVDIDQGMLAACEERGLPAEHKDALLALQERPAQSLAVVSGFHVAEHLPFETLQHLVKESLRVLKPGGLLILETPNPENIVVGTANFYLDPTHQRPLPPKLLSFLPEHYGFARTKVLRLQESPDLREASQIMMRDILGGASPDYAIVAQKKATARRMALFNAEFDKEYGLTTDTLARRYDSTVDEKITSRIESVEQNTEARLTETISRIEGIEQNTETLLSETVSRIEGVEKNTEARLTDTMLRIEGAEQTAGNRIGELRGDIAEIKRATETRTSALNARINEAVRETNARLTEVFQGKLRELEGRTMEMEAAFRAIRNSRSWKMTAPYRALGDGLRGAWQGFKNLLKPPAASMMRFVIARPSLNRFSLALLHPFPRFKARLKGLAVARGVVQVQDIQQLDVQTPQSTTSKDVMIDSIIARIMDEIELERSREENAS